MTYKFTVICVLMMLDRTFANSQIEFFKAALNGNVGYIKQALAEGTIDINWKNYYYNNGATALMTASYANQIEVVRILLEAGALVDEQDGTGMTALCFATAHESTDGVRSSIAEEAYFHYQKDGTPEFQPSFFKEQVSIVKMLIEANANVNIANMYGKTPLHYAASVNKKENVQELLDNGANPMARTSTKYAFIINGIENKYALTPAELARKYGYFEITNYIEVYYSGTAQEPTTASSEMYIEESTATTGLEYYFSLLRKLIIILVQNM